MDILNTWQFNTIGYLILVTLYTQSYKLAVRNAVRDGAATILLQLLGGISVLLFVPLFDFVFPSRASLWIMLIAACVFYAVNDRLQTTSRKHLPVSTFSISSQLTPVFLILIGLTVFSEPFHITKVAGAGLILVANLLLVYRRGALKINPYILVSFAASFAFSIAVSIDIGISESFNLPVYIMLTLIIPSIMLAFAEKITLAEVRAEFNTSAKKWYLVTGIVWGAMIICALRSFQLGQVTTVVPLQSTATLINVLVAYMFLHEKDDRLKKVIAALLIMGGVYLTVLA